MKIWNEYGSEHSANLVMIGTFKDIVSAEKAKASIDELSELVSSSDADHSETERFSEEVGELLRKVKSYTIRPTELEQFRYEVSCKQDGNRVVLSTDEYDVSAFLKLLIEQGARVEVYSAHDHPDDTGAKGT